MVVSHLFLASFSLCPPAVPSRNIAPHRNAMGPDSSAAGLRRPFLRASASALTWAPGSDIPVARGRHSGRLVAVSPCPKTHTQHDILLWALSSLPSIFQAGIFGFKETCIQLGGGEAAPHDCLSTRLPGGPMARRRDTPGALSNMQCSHFFIRMHISGAAGGMAYEISEFRQVTERVRMWESACFGCHD